MKFPKCFPDNFEKDILPKLDSCKAIDVYRIIKSGTIDREAFYSTFEEDYYNLIPKRRRMDLKDPGTYSTSCCMSISDAKYLLDVFMRNYPRPIIARGKTNVACGPSQITKERNPQRKDTHVDWWLYGDSSPQLYFREIDDEDLKEAL